MQTVAAAGPDLRARWLSLREAEPALRMRDAANRLGVSEAELVAARVGDGVTRLDGPWGDLVKALPGLGTVMALTRNEHVVHEKVGRFGEVSIFRSMGLVLNREIDLRLFLDHWRFGFAVAEPTAKGERQSLQFFDRDGTAVHKVYLRDDEGREAYRALVQRHRHAEQSPAIDVQVLPPAKAPRPDGAIDRALLRERWLALKDVHDFHALLHELEVGRTQAFRLAGQDIAYPVAAESFRLALEQAAAMALSIMVFAGSPGAIQIHTGPVSNLKAVGPWYNVLDPGFNLHLRQDRVAEAWVVKKPTKDGIVSSLEIFDSDGRQIAWMFGERHEGQPERGDWRALLADLPRLAGCVA